MILSTCVAAVTIFILFVGVPIAVAWPLIRDMTDDEFNAYAIRVCEFDYMQGRL